MDRERLTEIEREGGRKKERERDGEEGEGRGKDTDVIPTNMGSGNCKSLTFSPLSLVLCITRSSVLSRGPKTIKPVLYKIELLRQ